MLEAVCCKTTHEEEKMRHGTVKEEAVEYVMILCWRVGDAKLACGLAQFRIFIGVT